MAPKKTDIIIVGGGPAGSACAWKLRQKGMDVLLLDRHPFPRQKICAGWINPKVLDAINIDPGDYPFLLKRFNRLHFYIYGRHIPVRTRQYAIRRYEFDNWMLSRARVPVEAHFVKKIVREKETYVIDERYRCQYLIGAGGTHCPVHRTFFTQLNQRPSSALIAAVEAEYQIKNPPKECHLWFFDHHLPGYAWYVPKGDGWINIGIGGKMMKMKTRKKTILQHWQGFTKKLEDLKLIPQSPPGPRGHTYYLNQGQKHCRKDNAFIIGDAAGLATLDMGEGIHAAIKSGLSAAAAIAENKPFQPSVSAKLSLPGILFRWRRQNECSTTRKT